MDMGIIISRFSLLISHFWFFPGFTRVRLDIFVSKFCLLVFPPLPTFSLSSLHHLSPTAGRQQGIHIVVFLDDGLGEAPSLLCSHSTIVKSDLVSSGFVPNYEKSIWAPSQVLDWLGFTIDLFQGLLFVPGLKLKPVCLILNHFLKLIIVLLGNLLPLPGALIPSISLLVTSPT